MALAALAVLLATAGTVRAAEGLGFSLQFADEVSNLPLISHAMMPGEVLQVEAILAADGARFAATADAGDVTAAGPGHWRWRVPDEPGLYCLTVTAQPSGEQTCLQAMVMHPYDGQPVFNGYRIGRYPRTALRGDPAYARPRGLIEVTEANQDTPVSPHFTLGQFACKQDGGWPKYLLLDTTLLLKLELLREQIGANGHEQARLAVLSGYRTPHYNASIGNRTKYSRHAYGDAADIYVDVDGDGYMDDLNGDGSRSVADARLLYDLVERLTQQSWFQPFIGGLGLYGPKPHRGPFIHVDTRGTKVRW
ncbi:MAG TPA: D-Ala-D-Ala carboxypeptidase family metallohydrolase [Gammaproteobacteria bacterium]|nr:D-Ala-D-Ala carboxypeptidase family metallohydrolase [Gammaproteobacteria bacterium]